MRRDYQEVRVITGDFQRKSGGPSFHIRQFKVSELGFTV